MIGYIHILLFIIACLFVFVVMYDHCVNDKPWGSVLKNWLLLLFLSDISITIYKIAIVAGTVYFVYSFMHGSSLF